MSPTHLSSNAWRITLATVAWVALISALHYWRNVDHGRVQVLRMGYMPVVTNLACPLLDYATRNAADVRFEALKFGSFAEMGDALREGHIDAAFMIAPLAIVMRQQGVPVKVVYIGNRHESTLVVRSELPVRTFRDLAGHTLAVPMRYSGHNVAARLLARKYGIEDRIRILEMNPPDMPSALLSGGLDAYFVGEPFAMQAVRTGRARVLLHVEDVWPGFICNLLVVREDLLERRREWIARLVEGAARSGLWASRHPEEAARIVAKYWNMPAETVADCLTHPRGRFVYDRFVPKVEELRELAHRMMEVGLVGTDDVSGLVDDSLARSARLDDITDFFSILSPPVQPLDTARGEAPRAGTRRR
ncbi:ABC transporter substrate-binding protein [Dissulfurirhabdus thermomarina]|uniref:ABC transporter substrate-binding protein n=1 Tax=Dissulfurirhabdus thermomarina TaxID=1765737 RepID=A0A6N9TQX4_DISTH|nr:ABC transporter substrate-binding protein [Dissulfurirhabdus thermomarina]NDY43468.1 ABC transporter substrate-binding protein [Dissulfurirhabdus thermomarina]NMX23095.1 ABC transporter substrate-binding protein [Dissulfurirhabdus thermomarina]